MQGWVLGLEANLEQLQYRVASAISRSNHNLSCGTCNMPLTTRRDKTQCNVNNKRSTQWELPKLYTCATIGGGAKDISMDDAPKVQSAHEPTNYCHRYGLAHEAFHNESWTTDTTHIVS